MIRDIAVIGQIGSGTATKPITGVTLPDLTPKGIEQLELLSNDLKALAERIGITRARRVWALMERGIVASIPELCAYDWLERRHIQFIFQSSQMGGRIISGGSIVDFILFGMIARGVIIWRIMGEYWHKGAAIETKDAMQKARLLRTKIGSLPVVAVVDLWELDIYDRYPEVFERAEQGIGLRG